MADTLKCASCGKPLSPRAIEGLCPECLLKVGLGSDPGTGPGGGQRPAFIPPASEELERLFPQLQIIELIGQGGMGAVYTAVQKGLDRKVALKILPAEIGSDPGFAGRFNREARALARLNHPNIVNVHDSGQAGGLYYFLMEYVEGPNLRQVLASHRLVPREALAIVPQICAALQYAHDHGVVHRDIKPENVLIDIHGQVKIADFGLAKIAGRSAEDLRLTREGQLMGTPHYMAPEQVENPREVDHRADIYSLGVVFYEMLTGELPLGKFPLPSRKVHVDVRLDEVVLRTLEKEPSRRYQHASELKTDVEMISEPRRGNGPQEAAEPVSGPGGRKDAWSPLRTLSWTALWSVRPPRNLVLPLAVLLLPAVLFSWYLLKGQPRGLGPDAWILLGLWGLPASVGFGVLLAWPVTILTRTRTTGDPEIWSWPWRAIVAVVALGLSLPVGGVALATAHLVLQERHWNPAPEELLFAMGVWLATVLLGLTGIYFGLAACRRLWRGEANLRGALGAAAAVWLWPAVLACILLGWAGDAAVTAVKGPSEAVSAATIVQTGERLKLEILKCLLEAGWRPEGLSVRVSPDLRSAECRFGKVWKNGLSSEPFNGRIRLSSPRRDLWVVTGEGEFRSIAFSLDLAASDDKPQPVPSSERSGQSILDSDSSSTPR